MYWIYKATMVLLMREAKGTYSYEGTPYIHVKMVMITVPGTLKNFISLKKV